MPRKQKQPKKQMQKMSNGHQDVEFGTEYTPDFILPCPKCEKRTFDVSGRPECTIRVRYKCPHCSNIVIMPIWAANTRAKPRTLSH